MALSKAFLGSTIQDASGGSIACTVNSTGYTHIVAFVKHEGASTTITGADNKGSGAYNGLTIVDHANNDLHTRMLWVKIGTAGASHTVTLTFGAARAFSRMAVWGVSSGTGELGVDTSVQTSGTGTAINAGSLVTTTATASFMGVGEYFATNYLASGSWSEDLDNNIFAASRTDASGTFNADCTAADSMDWAANAASFKEASASGPGSGSDSSAVGMSEASTNLVRVNIVEETS
jgi:hypothetical protein